MNIKREKEKKLTLPPTCSVKDRERVYGYSNNMKSNICEQGSISISRLFVQRISTLVKSMDLLFPIAKYIVEISRHEDTQSQTLLLIAYPVYLDK